ncbi:lysozyme inhibitor LprI family protein [Pseudomonas sp. NPDC096950]|uniref:lysozyme inhibitor LprI family protein n=1 Tax=Pseudomonas sp. NPDC096950 TaxID=3364485 RepID=UPI003839F75D
MKKILLMAALLFPVSVLAAQVGCGETSTSQQVDVCAKLAKDAADADLNSSYKKLLNRVKTQYEADQNMGDSFMTKLKESQRAWLKLRDTNCALEAFEIEAGQPAYVTTVNNCIARMSMERSNYLNKTLPDL